MRKLLIYLVLLCGLFVSSAFNPVIIAQAPKSSKPSVKTRIKPKAQPFGYTIIDNLPPNYLGHSYGDLLSALINREKVVVKGEYESTNDYEARMTTVNSKPLVGATNYHSRFAFTFFPDSEQFFMKYDPDRKDLDIFNTWTPRSEFGKYFNMSQSLTWSETSRKMGSYIGRNLFNRSVRVSVYRNESFYLVTYLRNLERIGKAIDKRSLSSPVFLSYNASFLNSTLRASISMSPNEARLAKMNLRILIVGHLADKSIFFNQSHQTPTITDPYDRYNLAYAINLVVEEIWIYDYPTGNVLMRFAAT